MIMESVRKIVRGLADFASSGAVLADGCSLYDAGLSSYGAVELMLTLETELGIQVPDSMLTRDTFETINAITKLVETLQFQQHDTAGPAGSRSGTAAAVRVLVGAGEDSWATDAEPAR